MLKNQGLLYKHATLGVEPVLLRLRIQFLRLHKERVSEDHIVDKNWKSITDCDFRDIPPPVIKAT